MYLHTGVLPSLPVATTGQSLISHAGLNRVTPFADALGFRSFQQAVAASQVFDCGFATTARELRSRVWGAAGERNSDLTATALPPLIFDLDATLVSSHSDLA